MRIRVAPSSSQRLHLGPGPLAVGGVALHGHLDGRRIPPGLLGARPDQVDQRRQLVGADAEGKEPVADPAGPPGGRRAVAPDVHGNGSRRGAAGAGSSR